MRRENHVETLAVTVCQIAAAGSCDDKRRRNLRNKIRIMGVQRNIIKALTEAGILRDVQVSRIRSSFPLQSVEFPGL